MTKLKIILQTYVEHQFAPSVSVSSYVPYTLDSEHFVPLVPFILFDTLFLPPLLWDSSSLGEGFYRGIAFRLSTL